MLLSRSGIAGLIDGLCSTRKIVSDNSDVELYYTNVEENLDLYTLQLIIREEIGFHIARHTNLWNMKVMWNHETV